MDASRRVNDGTRTRDNQNHNLALYQLNYIHHVFLNVTYNYINDLFCQY